MKSIESDLRIGVIGLGLMGTAIVDVSSGNRGWRKSERVIWMHRFPGPVNRRGRATPQSSSAAIEAIRKPTRNA